MDEDDRQVQRALDVRGTSVLVSESMKADYGTFLWPCARVLSEYMVDRRENIVGKIVIELGAGTSLPGIVALKLDAKAVILTDMVTCLCNCQRNAESNGFPAKSYDVDGEDVQPTGCYVAEVNWGQLDRTHIALRRSGCTLVLASDVLYDTSLFESVIVSIAYLLKGNAHSECWMSYQRRSTNHNFDRLLDIWNLTSKVVRFDHLHGDIELFIITNKT